jgi:hypothetical protein
MTSPVPSADSLPQPVLNQPPSVAVQLAATVKKSERLAV